MVKIINVITIDGIVVSIIYRIWENKGVCVTEEANTVVSESGEILSPEISARDDRPGYPPRSEALCLTDTHQGRYRSWHGSPRATGHNGYDSADHATRGKEETRMDDLHPVINQGRDDTADHPATG